MQRQIDELVALLATGRADIAALEDRVDAAERRADAAEGRADSIEADIVSNREFIAELQADGVVSRKHVAQLEQALSSSRTIGTALGILMASRNINQDEAFAVMKEASSRANKPIRQLAEVIVAGPRTN